MTPRKKTVRGKSTRTKKPKPRPRPVFGFWYPDEKDADVEIIIKDARTDHLVVDEYWGEPDEG